MCASGNVNEAGGEEDVENADRQCEPFHADARVEISEPSHTINRQVVSSEFIAHAFDFVFDVRYVVQ